MALHSRVADHPDVTQSGGRSIGGRIYQALSSVPVWARLTLAVIWTVPSVGLLVDSFRSGRNRRGFWTVATDPGQLTLEQRHIVRGRLAGSING